MQVKVVMFMLFGTSHCYCQALEVIEQGADEEQLQKEDKEEEVPGTLKRKKHYSQARKMRKKETRRAWGDARKVDRVRKKVEAILDKGWERLQCFGAMPPPLLKWKMEEETLLFRASFIALLILDNQKGKGWKLALGVEGGGVMIRKMAREKDLVEEKAGKLGTKVKMLAAALNIQLPPEVPSEGVDEGDALASQWASAVEEEAAKVKTLEKEKMEEVLQEVKEMEEEVNAWDLAFCYMLCMCFCFHCTS